MRTYTTDLFVVGEKSANKSTKGIEVIEAGEEGTSILNSEDKKDKTKEKEKVLEHLADAEKVKHVLFCLKGLSHESCQKVVKMPGKDVVTLLFFGL